MSFEGEEVGILPKPSPSAGSVRKDVEHQIIHMSSTSQADCVSGRNMRTDLPLNIQPLQGEGGSDWLFHLMQCSHYIKPLTAKTHISFLVVIKIYGVYSVFIVTGYPDVDNAWDQINHLRGPRG